MACESLVSPGKIRGILRCGKLGKPDRSNPRGKRISIRLRHPNGCDLTEKTAKERLLGNKCLRRWGIFEEVAS